MRFPKILLLGSLAVLAAVPAAAAPMPAGSSVLAIELSRGVADYAVDVTPPLGVTEITLFNRPEVGVLGQYWYFLREDYAVSLSAGIGYFRQTDTPAPGGPGSTRVTLNSFQARLGGDRFASVSDKLRIFAGPGIQFWTGKQKYEFGAGGEAEEPSVTRWALSARMGAEILLSENFGLIGHLGQYWGYASAEEDDAESKSLPSGTEGALGFAFGF